MQSKLAQKLYDRYPKLFVQKDLSMMQTCMCWGIDCGDGWFLILDQMCTELQTLNQELQFTQVKEKFGTLRVYLNNYSDEAEHIISKACDASEITCEACGDPGSINNGGWLSVRCSPCRKKKVS